MSCTKNALSIVMLLQNGKPMSAKEISETSHISLKVVYGVLKCMIELKMVIKKGDMTDTGKKFSLYLLKQPNHSIQTQVGIL